MSEPTSKPKPGAVLIGFLVLLIGEAIILVNAGVKLFPSDIMPEPISTYAEDVDMLFYLILGITGFFFFLTQGMLIYFVVKYRAREEDKSKARHTHGNHALELAWTFIPGLILFCLAVFQTGTWGAIKFKSEMPDESDPETVVVQVFAKQFEWHFRYAGPDRTFGTVDDVTKLGALHVPVNKEIVLKLQTRDVLHSFWLENVRLKQDLLPGQTIPQWFEAYKTGKFEIKCAELCGAQHTTMRADLVVQTEEEFQAWLKEQKERFGPHEPADDAMWQYWRE